MNDKEKFVNVAELKKKVRYWAKTRGMSDSSLQNFLSMIGNLPVTVKGELETTLDGEKSKPVGEWEYDTTIGGMRYYRCSICVTGYHTIASENDVKWWRFCPRCGSKMFTKTKEEDE